MQKYTPESKDENHKTPEIIRWYGYEALDDNKGKEFYLHSHAKIWDSYKWDFLVQNLTIKATNIDFFSKIWDFCPKNSLKKSLIF